MLPTPTMPSVLLEISEPVNFDFSHLPPFIEAVAWGIERASESSMLMACSAVVTLLPPGVFITAMPRLVAASTSMLSTPMPARPMTRSFAAASTTSLVTVLALRTMRPSYSPMALQSSSGFMPTRSSTCSWPASMAC